MRKPTKETQKEVKYLEELFEKYWQIRSNALHSKIETEKKAIKCGKDMTISERIDNGVAYSSANKLENLSEDIQDSLRDIINAILKFDEVANEVQMTNEELYDDIIGGSEE